MKNNNTISPLAIDLGSKSTGVLTVPSMSGEIFTKGFVIEFDPKHFQPLQESRRAKRHQKRNNYRRRLAKRLLKVILEESFDWNFQKTDEKQQAFLFGLMNRRGFNYLVEDIDKKTLDNIDTELFSKLFPSLYDPSTPFFDQLQKKDIKWFKSFAEHENLRLTQKNNKNSKSLKTFCEGLNYENIKDSYDELWEQYCAFKNAVQIYHEALVGGNRHRSLYFDKIEEALKQNKILNPLYNKKINQAMLGKLIGHISNLPLRVLRRYFNDKKMKKKDYFSDKRLKKLINREVRQWHPKEQKKDDIKTRRAKLISLLKSNKAIIDIWLEKKPTKTITPYEDMNNRNIPTCQTLYLDPSKLDKELPKWKSIVESLTKKEAWMADELPESKDIDKNDVQARILQRFLDRSKGLDRYELRTIANLQSDEKNTQDYTGSIDELEHNIGVKNACELRLFARKYYAEIRLIKKGLWDEKHTVFKKCNHHTKHNTNIDNILIGQILGITIEKKAIEDFKNFLENQKIENKTFKGITKTASETVKNKGNGLKYLWNKMLFKRSENIKMATEEKDLFKLYNQIIKASEKIYEQYNLPRITFNDPWSFAQIYQILYADRHGFTKICAHCHHENNFRMRMKTIENGKESALCSRLVADSVRPISGVISRIMEKEAAIIAKLKIKELQDIGVKTGDDIFIPIFIEENSFKFEEDLRDFRSNRGKQKKSKNIEEIKFKDKTTRIKAFNTICPYTGESIGDNGDIDHILSRSYTRKCFNTVMDNELNLIYASQSGNREIKAKKNWEFNWLHPNFLKEIYGTEDKLEIEENIKRTLSELGITDHTRREPLVLHRLNLEQRKDLKIALFIPGFRKNLIDYMKNSLAGRVNGTQAYLGKLIVSKIRENFPKASFDLIKVDNVAIQLERERLSQKSPELAKNRSAQGLYSHVIDASIAFYLGFNGGDQDFLSLLPKELAIIEAKRKSTLDKNNPRDFYSTQVFKDGIYAEKFIPLIFSADNRAFFGFDLKNAVELNVEPVALFEMLKPYLLYQNKELDFSKDWETKILQENYIRFSFNKRKVFEFFEKIAHQPASDEKINLFKLLNALRYCVQNKKIEDIFKGENDKNYRTKEEILYPKKKNNYKINLNLKNIKVGNQILEITNQVTSLTFPGICAIQKILEDESVKKALGKSTSDHSIDMKYIKDKYFTKTASTTGRHKARKIYSLPQIKAPSGGFRIRRKDNQGREIFQLMEIEGASTVGFEITRDKKGNPKIDKNKFVLHRVIYDDPRITPVDYIYRSYPDKYVRMDEWREVPLKDEEKAYIQKLMICPGSKSRSYFELTMSIKNFQKYIRGKDIYIYTLKTNLKIPNFNLHNKLSIIINPRSNLFIRKLSGKEITFWYIANGFMSNELQKRYLESQT